MKTYCLLQKRPRKALKYGCFRGLIFHASASLFPHVVSLLLPQSSPGAAGGAIPCPAIREKGPAAYRAGPGFRGGAFRSEGRLQHGIIGQHRLPEIAAQRPRPALLQHIAGTVQRQAAHIPVIVGAQPCHQFADGRLFLTGQLSGHRFTSRRQRLSAAPGSRPRTRSPASRGSRSSGSLPGPCQAQAAHTGEPAASSFHRDYW